VERYGAIQPLAWYRILVPVEVHAILQAGMYPGVGILAALAVVVEGFELMAGWV